MTSPPFKVFLTVARRCQHELKVALTKPRALTINVTLAYGVRDSRLAATTACNQVVVGQSDFDEIYRDV